MQRTLFRCDAPTKGAPTHVSRPLLVKRYWAEAAIVMCTARTRKNKPCGALFVAFDESKEK